MSHCLTPGHTVTTDCALSNNLIILYFCDSLIIIIIINFTVEWVYFDWSSF